ncbi:MAG: hypothetical protein GWP05_08855 [Anaerolineaceae bacterium]|nr:hypothetical protein [Anaerolineaceae bacterium]
MLELLVATAVSCLVLMAIAMALSGSVRTKRKIDQKLDALARARGVMNLICDDLSRLHVYDSRAYLIVEKRQVAQRQVTSIAFPCLTPIRVSEELREKPGLLEIAYLVGQDPNDENALALFRRELPIETDRSARQIRTSDQGLVLLADGLSELNMEFLPQPTEDDPLNGRQAEYVQEWEGGFGVENMPAAIRIRVSTDHRENRDKALVYLRTVRLPIPAVTDEMLQPALKESLEREE